MDLRSELLKSIWYGFTALDLEKSGKVSKSQLKVSGGGPLPGNLDFFVHLKITHCVTLLPHFLPQLIFHHVGSFCARCGENIVLSKLNVTNVILSLLHLICASGNKSVRNLILLITLNVSCVFKPHAVQQGTNLFPIFRVKMLSLLKEGTICTSVWQEHESNSLLSVCI